jgi:pimeloyl-ACP methyl ester carboxylesterase
MRKINPRLRFLAPKTFKSNAPLFVYLPGMDGTGKLLHTQREIWNFFDVRCLVIPPDDLSNWDSLSSGIINLVERELNGNNGRSVYICGESFGGCLALSVISQAPWLFEKIILVNPASSFRRQFWSSFGVGITQIMPNLLQQYSSTILLPFLASLPRIEISDRLALLSAMNSLSPQVIAWRLSLLRDFFLEDLCLNRITQEVLLIASQADLLLPSVEEADRLSQIIPNNKKVILPDSGHACLIEKNVNLYHIMQRHQLSTTETLEISNT